MKKISSATSRPFDIASYRTEWHVAQIASVAPEPGGRATWCAAGALTAAALTYVFLAAASDTSLTQLEVATQRAHAQTAQLQAARAIVDKQYATLRKWEEKLQMRSTLLDQERARKCAVPPPVAAYAGEQTSTVQ